jgi:hypothetical protein
MKIVIYTNDCRFSASPGHDGQGGFKFSFTDPPQVCPVGGGGNHHDELLDG